MGLTVVYGTFEWDEDKARSNLVKHGISFEEAATVFDDPFFFAYKDPKHSDEEDCYVIIGVSECGRLLKGAFTVREGTRIMSHSRSNRHETELHRKENGEAVQGQRK